MKKIPYFSIQLCLSTVENFMSGWFIIASIYKQTGIYFFEWRATNRTEIEGIARRGKSVFRYILL